MNDLLDNVVMLFAVKLAVVKSVTEKLLVKICYWRVVDERYFCGREFCGREF